jgi:hypothetical protein
MGNYSSLGGKEVSGQEIFCYGEQGDKWRQSWHIFQSIFWSVG